MQNRMLNAEPMSSGSSLGSISFFCWRESTQKGMEDIRGEEWVCVAIDGRIGQHYCDLYILQSLPLYIGERAKK